MRNKKSTFVFVILALSCQVFAVRPVVAPRYHRMHRFRRVRWNPVFKPSRESLLLQNAEINRLNLPRIRDDRQLEQLTTDGDGIRDGGCRGVVRPFPNGLRLIRSRPAAGQHEDCL